MITNTRLDHRGPKLDRFVTLKAQYGANHKEIVFVVDLWFEVKEEVASVDIDGGICQIDLEIVDDDKYVGAAEVSMKDHGH